jgi:outer membrane receptor protein involved in Fe transport
VPGTSGDDLHPRLRGGRRLLSVPGACVVGAAANAADPPAANPAKALELPTVSVIGTPLEDVPANVQVYTGDSLGR